MNKIRKYFFNLVTLVIILIATGCANYKSVPYFQNSDEFDGSKGARQFDLIIQPQDQLNIFVFSQFEELAASFNKRERVGLEPGLKLNDASNRGGFYKYLVDTEGNIDFPQVGKIHVAGLTIEQTNAAVKAALKPFFKDEQSYMVNTYD